MALQTSCTIPQAVDLPMPDKWLIVRYSTFVASLHSATATLWRVGIALRNLVFCLDISGASSSQMWFKVSLHMRKFLRQSSAVHVLLTTRCHQSELRSSPRLSDNEKFYKPLSVHKLLCQQVPKIVVFAETERYGSVDSVDNFSLTNEKQLFGYEELSPEQ